MSLANYRSSRAQTGETASACQQAGACVNLTKFLPVADGLRVIIHTACQCEHPKDEYIWHAVIKLCQKVRWRAKSWVLWARLRE